MATNKLSPYDPYKVIKSNFAQGGNADVSLVVDENGKEYVLKCLRIQGNADLKKAKRFLNEIEILEMYQNRIKGIIPLNIKIYLTSLKLLILINFAIGKISKSLSFGT